VITKDEINATYGLLQMAIRSYATAQEAYLIAKYDLDRKINRAIADSMIAGKNEAERSGNIDYLFGEELDRLYKLKLAVDQAKYDKEWYSLEAERVQTLIKLAEILKVE